MESGRPAGGEMAGETAADTIGERADGRTRLLDTAEELLDRHGIDGVSVRTVTKAAGHRNSSAVNYHFGNREQLVQAVFRRRQAMVEASRVPMLEALETQGGLTPRDALRVAVEPLVALLAEPCGRRYLRLLHQAANHPDYYTITVEEFSPTMARARAAVLPLVAHVPAELQVHRLRVGIGIALAALSDQARLIDLPSPPRPVIDPAVLTADLLRVITAALAA